MLVRSTAWLRRRFVAGLAIFELLACGGDDGTATASDTSSSTATSSVSASGSASDSTSGTSKTTTTASTSSDTSTSSESTTSADTSTTTSATDSYSGGTDSGSSSGGTTGGGAVINLDPDTLEFFDLPIGSIRYAVAGQDLASDTCVTLVWIYGDPFQPKCATSMQDWPYAIVTPGATAPCMQWDYGGNVTVDAAMGCVEFMNTNPLTADVEMTVEVSNGPFEGTINVDNVP